MTTIEEIICQPERRHLELKKEIRKSNRHRIQTIGHHRPMGQRADAYCQRNEGIPRDRIAK
jgi:hypothetical protein